MKAKTNKKRLETLVVGERLNGPGYPRRRWRARIDGKSHERLSPFCSHFGRYEGRSQTESGLEKEKKVSKWTVRTECVCSQTVTVYVCHSIVKGEVLGIVFIHLL
jgi:hypothetical protein